MSPMIRVYLVLYAATFVLWLFCVIDSIAAREGDIRNLPKAAWVLIVLLFPFVGSIAWIVAGRPQDQRRRLEAWEREQPAYPEYDRPGRAAAVDPDQDREFLEQVRARGDEQRKAYKEQQRRLRAEEDERIRIAREKLRKDAGPTTD